MMCKELESDIYIDGECHIAPIYRHPRPRDIKSMGLPRQLNLCTVPVTHEKGTCSPFYLSGGIYQHLCQEYLARKTLVIYPFVNNYCENTTNESTGS